MKQTREIQVTQTIIEDVCDKCGLLVVLVDENIGVGGENYTKQGIIKGEVAYHLNCVRVLDGKSEVL